MTSNAVRVRRYVSVRKLSLPGSRWMNVADRYWPSSSSRSRGEVASPWISVKITKVIDGTSTSVSSSSAKRHARYAGSEPVAPGQASERGGSAAVRCALGDADGVARRVPERGVGAVAAPLRGLDELDAAGGQVLVGGVDVVGREDHRPCAARGAGGDGGEQRTGLLGI